MLKHATKTILKFTKARFSLLFRMRSIAFLCLGVLSTLSLSCVASAKDRPPLIQKEQIKIGYLARHAVNPTYIKDHLSVKRYDEIEWDLTKHLNEKISEKIQAEPGFAGVDLNGLGFEPQDVFSLIDSKSEGRLSSVSEEIINKLKNEHNIDYVVDIYPDTTEIGLNCFALGCNEIVSVTGASLTTIGHLLDSYSVRLSLGLKFNVYDLHHLIDLSEYARTNTPNARFQIESFTPPKDLENISAQEWEQFYQHFLLANDDLANRVIATIKGTEVRCWKYKPKKSDTNFRYGPEKVCTKQ